MARVSIHRKMPSDKPGSTGARFKYQRLVAVLEREVRERYAPGERFASELDLCARMNLNRDTVHKAIRCLEHRGLLVRKGRAGTYVADFTEKGFDNRLVASAFAIRNHVWDQLFLSLSNASIAAGRFCLICDFTGINTANPFAERLPAAAMAERLKACLRFRPRTLVTELAAYENPLFEAIGEARWSFRNLILVNQSRLPGFERVVSVLPDRRAAWRLLAHSARRGGYGRICLFVPPSPMQSHWPQIQEELVAAVGGSYPVDQQGFLMEHDPEWPAKLRAFVKASPEPVAVLCDYDWGAHLAKEVLLAQGVQIPQQVGLFGMNNTGWSVQDELTSVGFDPDLWAREIFAADVDLDKGSSVCDRLIPPMLVQRKSTLPVQ